MRSSQTPAQKTAAVLVAEAEIDARAKDDPLIPNFRALRPCTRCGFMRRVVVRIVRTAIYVHEDPYGRLVPTFKNDGETYESYCHACALERNAIKYERLASTNRKRAAEERTRQAMRHLKPYKTKGASK